VYKKKYEEFKASWEDSLANLREQIIRLESEN
jgi:hypothetical protein